MNPGAFSLMIDFINLTQSQTYSGNIYGWELIFSPLDTLNITYPITKNTDIHRLKNDYIVELE